MPAQITANIVIASLKRLMLVRHFCRNKNRMALMSVPACPMPIQKTKFVMSNAHATGTLLPHTPTPVEIRYVAANMPPDNSADEMRNAGHHQYGCGFSVISLICVETESKSAGPHTSGMRGSGSGNFGRSACGVSGVAEAVVISTGVLH